MAKKKRKSARSTERPQSVQYIVNITAAVCPDEKQWGWLPAHIRPLAMALLNEQCRVLINAPNAKNWSEIAYSGNKPCEVVDKMDTQYAKPGMKKCCQILGKDANAEAQYEECNEKTCKPVGNLHLSSRPARYRHNGKEEPLILKSEFDANGQTYALEGQVWLLMTLNLSNSASRAKNGRAK